MTLHEKIENLGEMVVKMSGINLLFPLIMSLD